MKIYLSILLSLITFTTFVYNEEPFFLCRETFSYVQMGAGATFIGQGSQAAPSIALGRRYSTPNSALDISFQISSGDKGVCFYSAPRVLYLAYFSPNRVNSFYAGGGLSWSGFLGENRRKDNIGRDKQTQKCHGIAGELALGCEFCRTQIIRPFAQINITQALFPSSRRGSFPSPSIVAYLGAGL